jgi:broad specificity phosphatase PhoE
LIYLCRHGQTEYNREGRMQGRMDSALTGLGRAQAGAMASLLHGLIPDAGAWRLVASPQMRAKATAEAIGGRLGLPVTLDDRLMEISVGAWEGHLIDDLRRRHPDAFAERDWHFRAPDGETYDQVYGRASGWLADQDPARPVIVVSHGVTGRLIRGAYLGLGPQAAMDLPIPQDAVFRLHEGKVQRIDCETVTLPSLYNPSSGPI